MPNGDFIIESACRTITVHLDGLDRDAIIHLVTKAMRDADYDTMLATAVDWGAPVHFLKDGQQWIKVDWKRLTLLQRAKRWFPLWRGSYVHPDETIELASAYIRGEPYYAALR